MSLMLVRPAVSVLVVHGFILISAILYSKLEFKDYHGSTPPTLACLVAAKASGSLDVAAKNRSSTQFLQLAQSYENAYRQELKRNMSIAFGDLTKAYFFSLTTVSTVGNSDMFLQNKASKDFYIFCIIAGIVLYVTALHHIAALLLPVMKYACQTQDDKNQLTGRYSRAYVMAFSYGMLIVSILLLGIAAIFASHTYVFGLYASFDNILSIGNVKWFTYLMPWNEEAFVVGLDLFLFLGHSLLYTTVYITIHFVRTDEVLAQIGRWSCFGGMWSDYEPIEQHDPQAGASKIVSDDENDDVQFNESSLDGASDVTPLLRRPVDPPRQPLPTFVIEDVDSSLK